MKLKNTQLVKLQIMNFIAELLEFFDPEFLSSPCLTHFMLPSVQVDMDKSLSWTFFAGKK